MLKTITTSGLCEQVWTQLPEDAVNVTTEKTLIPFSRLPELTLEVKESLLGICVENDIDLNDESLVAKLLEFGLIALNFPKYVDGRAYSQARILRDRYGYKGEIRATGDVLRDQIYYMFRCGFSQFELRADQDAEQSLSEFTRFTVQYQNSVEQETPLFRRRA